MRRRRAPCLKIPLTFVCTLVFVSCLLILSISLLRLPEGTIKQLRNNKIIKPPEDLYGIRIGEFGRTVLEMLPDDLPFTIFMPSEKAFERDLRLNVNHSFAADELNDTRAVLSRILGFSAVPIRIIASTMGRDISYDSLSGFNIYIWKDLDGMLVVNRVRSQRVDIMKGMIVVHIIDGVMMDAEFQQSVQPDDTEEEEH